MAVNPLDLWNDWSTQVLVLASLALQLVLFLFAGIRRREAPMVPMFILWIAYQLADSTALYTIGHLSLSAAADRHQLVAFWAPFLLLHLGGPDNITAYALQDNELWHRHLLTLVVQVIGTAYVLYKHIINNGTLIVVATILMSAIGIVKYGEKIWALRCGNLDYIQSSVKKQQPAKHNHVHPHDKHNVLIKEEDQLRRAHSLFGICRRAMVDSSVGGDEDKTYIETNMMLRLIKDGANLRYLWAVMEMELSLMYDTLYTKAAVVHTWFGYCVRFVSPVAVFASLLLFLFSDKDRYSIVDVVVTYVLLAGALFMEIIGLLNAVASTWTFAFLYATRWSWIKYELLCSGRWDRLRLVFLSLTQHVWGRITRRSSPFTRRRRWSCTMGQYNMLHYCSGCDKPAGPLPGRLASMLGSKEQWDRKHYAGKIQFPDEIRRMVTDYMRWLYSKEGGYKVNTLGMLREMWSLEALKKWQLDEELKPYIGVEFQEGIIIWHIATEVFLVRSKSKVEMKCWKAVRVMSNYMMFLLVERPYMLPGLSQVRLYQQTCSNLVKIRDEDNHDDAIHHRESFLTTFSRLFRMRDDPNNPTYSRMKQTEELAIILHNKNPPRGFGTSRLSFAVHIANTLLARDLSWSLQVLLEVWRDMLVYAANRCNRESHAKKLSSGGELITIIWLMIEHRHQISAFLDGKQ